VATTVTDATGAYSFEVPAGDYRVHFPDVGGVDYADQNVGAEETDSDVNADGLTDVITLGAGQTIDNVDASLQPEPAPNGVISGRVTHDDDLDQTEVNTVDDDNAAPLDTGLSGLTVTLLDTDGTVVASTVTDDTGAYSFDVPAGDYRVLFPDVDGQDFAEQNLGDEATDSDANADGLTDVISVVSGQTVSDVDASLVNEPAESDASVKGRVFRDDNSDSLDSYEDGVADVEVSLHQADGTLVATTTTTDEGVYIFENLDPGDYFVSFDADSLEGRVFATQDVDGNVSDDIDSDVDASGASDIFSLAAGQQIIDLDAGVQDAGTAEISGRYFVDENDNAVDDAETGLGGMEVVLLNEDGFVSQVTQTDDTGAYSFTGVDAGLYRVAFEQSIENGPFVEQYDPHGVGDETTDSNVNSEGVSDYIRVGIGQIVTDMDAGVMPGEEIQLETPDGGGMPDSTGIYEDLMRDAAIEEAAADEQAREALENLEEDNPDLMG
jgi:protocatechuate 3,4-dioxygenase beta subunit